MATIGRLFQPPKGHFFLFGPRGTGKSNVGPAARLALLYRGDDRLLVDGVPCLPVGDFLSAVRPGAPLPT
jgi:hypothetical protein